MPLLRKRPTTSTRNRLSSFFPSLISPQFTEPSSPTPPQPPAAAASAHVHRKPLAEDSPLKDGPPLPARPATSGQTHDSARDPSGLPAFVASRAAPDDASAHRRTPSDEHSLERTAQAQKPIPQPPTGPPPPPPIQADSSDSLNAQVKKLRSPSKLKKRHSENHLRTDSNASNSQQVRPQSTLMLSASPEPRGRSSSAQPPSDRLGATLGAANLSATNLAARPGSSNGSQSPTRDADKRGRLRRSWLPGVRSRSNSADLRNAKGAAAWILGQDNTEYNTTLLTNGEKVPELWNEAGSILVHLHPASAGLGPSFKVPSFCTDFSLAFQDAIELELSSPANSSRSFLGRDNLSATDAAAVQPPPLEPAAPGDIRLYVPGPTAGPDQPAVKSDVDRLVSIRNMFAFLTGQPLVCTKAQPTLFAVFLRVANLLSEFEFTNHDGSNFGDAVEMGFGFFMEQTALADVRHSREKTLEALVLGERMKSWDLYSEAFAHAVGKYSAIRDLKSNLWEQVSAPTRQRLERAHLDLLNRQSSVNNRLESFEFPSLFSGTANSTSMTEFRNVKYGIWRKCFGRMRQFVLNYYKSNFGSWPPKARSKKNPFSESGLNRQVLKILYSDLCALYDLVVDRESITPRGIDQNAEDIQDEGSRPEMSALRRILGEYDASSPPVVPPIPFDVPRVPDMTSIKENYYSLPHKEQTKLERNLQEYEFLLILNKSYDFETSKLKIPFLEEFKDWERKEAKGKSVSEMADQRIGYWLFLYVVIQCLPMLVVDAPGLKFTEGVEYFLCQPPKGHPPWMGAVPDRKRWYEVSGGAGYVELNADAVEFSIEGIYHRSHCWLAAKSWEADAAAAAPLEEDAFSPLPAPQPVFADNDSGLPASPGLTGHSESPMGSTTSLALRPRSGSPAGRPGYRSSVVMGLEPVNLPPSAGTPVSDYRSSRVFSAGDMPMSPLSAGGGVSRSRSSGNLHAMGAGAPAPAPQDAQGSTFDDILKDMDKKPKKKKTLFG